MQASEEQVNGKKERRFKLSNLIWGGIFAAILLCGAAVGVYLYKNIPTSDWRMSGLALPWKSADVEIREADAFWRNSKGHARMELRAAYYPVLQLQLGDCGGSGHLIIRFADASGVQKGETISLAYNQGQFRPTQDTNVKAEAKTAEVFIETGFASDDMYTVHKLTETSPLWRVAVWSRPTGSYNEQFIGYTCIAPEEK